MINVVFQSEALLVDSCAPHALHTTSFGLFTYQHDRQIDGSSGLPPRPNMGRMLFPSLSDFLQYLHVLLQRNVHLLQCGHAVIVIVSSSLFLLYLYISSFCEAMDRISMHPNITSSVQSSFRSHSVLDESEQAYKQRSCHLVQD